MSAKMPLVLQVEIDPQDAGFDPNRLARIDRNYQRYVDEGKLPGFLAVIARDGKVVHVAKGGLRDVEAGTAVEADTLFRIYSMTKPITSVAAMMLWEEGAFELKDEVARFIPAFADARVWSGGSQQKPMTVPAARPGLPTVAIRGVVRPVRRSSSKLVSHRSFESADVQ